MKKDLEDRLKIVYPTGKLKRHRKAALYGLAFREKVNDLLCERLPKHNAVVTERIVYDGLVVFKWVINLSKDPSFRNWTSMSHEKHLQWFDRNNRRYPVLCLECSRVWPAFYWHYNIWKKPSAEDSRLIDCTKTPYDKDWIPIHEEIDNAMKELHIEYLTKEELLEPVPFVIRETWLDNENGADAEDVEEGEPVFELEVTAAVECLFQNY